VDARWFAELIDAGSRRAGQLAYTGDRRPVGGEAGTVAVARTAMGDLDRWAGSPKEARYWRNNGLDEIEELAEAELRQATPARGLSLMHPLSRQTVTREGVGPG